MLERFGAGDVGITAGDFLNPDIDVLKMGREPIRIEMMSKMKGIDFPAGVSSRRWTASASPCWGWPICAKPRVLLAGTKIAMTSVICRRSGRQGVSDPNAGITQVMASGGQAPAIPGDQTRAFLFLQHEQAPVHHHAARFHVAT